MTWHVWLTTVWINFHVSVCKIYQTSQTKFVRTSRTCLANFQNVQWRAAFNSIKCLVKTANFHRSPESLHWCVLTTVKYSIINFANLYTFQAESLQQEVDSAKEKLEEVTLDLQIMREEVQQAGTDGGATSYQVKQLEQQNERLKEALVKWVLF